MEMGGHRKAPDTLHAENEPVPIVQEAGWAPGSVWTGLENLVPTGIRSWDRPACREWLYPHCAIPARIQNQFSFEFAMVLHIVRAKHYYQKWVCSKAPLK
jgi:hypothetical protein